MILENALRVDAPIERVWSFLRDLRCVVSCLPGANIWQGYGEKTIGTVNLSVGAMSVGYRASVELIVDERAGTVLLTAQGREQAGQGSLAARIRIALDDCDETTYVTLGTELLVTGGVAQFGRGRGLLTEISSRLLTEFGENLEQSVLDDEHVERVATSSRLAARHGESVTGEALE